MNDFDEKILKKQSKDNFKDFLEKEKRSLITYTKDSNLMYIPDEKIEKFHMVPQKQSLYLPLSLFLEKDLNNLEIIFHIYYELALYSDWKKNASIYLNRKKSFQKQVDEMSKFILKKIESEGLQNDRAYSEIVITSYVKREITDFLYTMDRYYSFLKVLQLSPIYRDVENFENLKIYLKKREGQREKIIELPKHKAYSNSFMIIELFSEIPKIDRVIKNPFEEEIFGQDLFSFVRFYFIKQINRNNTVLERDEFIKSFVYPSFEKLWKEEIEEITLQKSKVETKDTSNSSENPFSDERIEDEDGLEISKEDQEKMLQEMVEEEVDISSDVEDIVKGRIDLEPYGVSQQEQDLFNYYSQKVSKERQEMKNFWRELIGNAKKEVNVKKKEQRKGKLDVDSLIKKYPDFLEAEKKGSYKNLPIFSKYELEKVSKELPEKIEISFLIDNSGSMTKSKIEAGRNALAVTLLSLEDFNEYLSANSEKLNQNVEVLSETWFYGSNYYKVKKFKYKNNSKKEKSDIINSIVKLNGEDGATDDASLLKEINKNISGKQELRIKNGKEIKILFQITDGASSFPGLAKEEVKELIDKNVKVFAFQIGKTSEKDQELFNFVWNEGHENNHGVIIGEEINKLPTELLKAVGKNLENIFRK